MTSNYKMEKPLTESLFLAELRRRVADAGSLKAFGREVGIAPSYLSNVLRGQKPFGKDFARRLGYDIVSLYVKRSDEHSKT